MPPSQHVVHLEGRQVKLMQIEKKRKKKFNTSEGEVGVGGLGWGGVGVSPGCACESVHTGG